MAKVVTFIEKEFILTQVMKSAGQVIVFGTGKNVTGTIKRFDKEYLSLDAKPIDIEAFKPWDPISIFLSHQGQRVTFPAKVKKVTGGELVIGLPENFFKAPQRKAVRVQPPHDFKLEFMLQNENIHIDCPESREYSELEMPALSGGFDIGSLNGLLSSFRLKAETMFSRCGVVMFSKNRKPETIEESLMAEMGRSLLIPSTRSPLPAADPYPEGRIITQAMADSFEGPQAFVEGYDLERSRLKKAELGVVTELYCPILYYQYVVGYVYLMNDESKKVCLDYRAVDFAWEFAKILAFELKSNKYFKAEEGYVPATHEPRVVDLSSGGCLFVLPKQQFKIKVKVGSVLTITMNHAMIDHAISVKGRVARRYDDKENEYYGIAFLNGDDCLADFRRSLYADDADRLACDEASLAL